MLRTGEQYRDGLRDGREVWIDGERVKDVTRHPALKPIIDLALELSKLPELTGRDKPTVIT